MTAIFCFVICGLLFGSIAVTTLFGCPAAFHAGDERMQCVAEKFFSQNFLVVANHWIINTTQAIGHVFYTKTTLQILIGFLAAMFFGVHRAQVLMPQVRASFEHFLKVNFPIPAGGPTRMSGNYRGRYIECTIGSSLLERLIGGEHSDSDLYFSVHTLINTKNSPKKLLFPKDIGNGIFVRPQNNRATKYESLWFHIPEIISGHSKITPEKAKMILDSLINTCEAYENNI